MRIGIATDYGGFGLKEELVGRISVAGHEVVDSNWYAYEFWRHVGEEADQPPAARGRSD